VIRIPLAVLIRSLAATTFATKIGRLGQVVLSLDIGFRCNGFRTIVKKSGVGSSASSSSVQGGGHRALSLRVLPAAVWTAVPARQPPGAIGRAPASPKLEASTLLGFAEPGPPGPRAVRTYIRCAGIAPGSNLWRISSASCPSAARREARSTSGRLRLRPGSQLVKTPGRSLCSTDGKSSHRCSVWAGQGPRPEKVGSYVPAQLTDRGSASPGSGVIAPQRSASRRIARKVGAWRGITGHC